MMRGRRGLSKPERVPAVGSGGELALIEGIRRAFAGVGGSAGKRGPVALGIGDDCAVLRTEPGTEVLVTTDMTLEGRHFRRDLHPAESVGHRCLARGLSDLAAMGATPMAAFLSLALPLEMLSRRAGRAWMERFLEGMRALADRSGVPLAGGDTAEAMGGLVMADIVLVGSAPVGRSLRRSGAKVGDGLYVTGALGGAAAEFEGMLARGARRAEEAGAQGADRGQARALRGWAEVEVQRRHPQMFPQPRLGVGEALLRRGLATACVDVSDGLSTDVAHLVRESAARGSGARASGLGAEVVLDWLPVHEGAAGRTDARRLVLDGGEDYELLFTAGEGVRVPRRIGGVGVTRIGRMVRRRGGEPMVMALEEDGTRRELKAEGWEHFSGAKSGRGREAMGEGVVRVLH